MADFQFPTIIKKLCDKLGGYFPMNNLYLTKDTFTLINLPVMLSYV